VKTDVLATHSQSGKIPPGPSEAQNFWESPFESFAQLIREYGDIVSLDPNTHRAYLINHPDYIKHVLQSNYRNYTRNANSFKLIAGNGLFMSEGDAWLRQRRMMQPAFHRQSIESLLSAMVRAIEKLITDWQVVAEQGKRIDMLTEMMNVMTTISATAMFGVDLQEEVQSLTRALTTAQEFVYYRGWAYSEQDGKELSDEQIQFQQAMDTIDKIAYHIIGEGRKNHQRQDNLLAMLLRASDEETGDGMSEEQLRDEVVGMLAGGRETTAITLTWIYYMLSMYPEVEQCLFQEIQQVLGQRLPMVQDLPKLTYTRMVIDEVLRFYPPGWLLARRSIGPDEIAGYAIPEDSEIFIDIYAVHRHPSFWENPERFDPERFSLEQTAKRSHFVYLPFSTGPRVCIGNNFALFAMQLVLAMTLQTYKLALTSEHAIQVQPRILLQPYPDILMTLQKR